LHNSFLLLKETVKKIERMEQCYRRHTSAVPDFHHYDLPVTVVQHPLYEPRHLMLDREYLLLQHGEVQCRIMYSAQYKNFKIIRPDNIAQRTWHELKHSGGLVVQRYVAWYATPAPPTTPASLRCKFMSGIATLVTADANDDSTLEDGETPDWTPAQLRAQMEIYFANYPHMRKHPYVYAFLCGKMVPSLDDVAVLVSFQSFWTDNDEALTMLFRNLLHEKTADAEATCRALCRANICPPLVNIDGYLTYDLPSRVCNDRVLDDLRHDQAIDLLVLAAFAREAAHLNVTAPLLEHMDRVLPRHALFRLYNREARILQLRHSRLWRVFVYSRMWCGRHREHCSLSRQLQYFDICSACVVQSAQQRLVANWFQPPSQQQQQQHWQYEARRQGSQPQQQRQNTRSEQPSSMSSWLQRKRDYDGVLQNGDDDSNNIEHNASGGDGDGESDSDQRACRKARRVNGNEYEPQANLDWQQHE
jgi:hypothetical protein